MRPFRAATAGLKPRTTSNLMCYPHLNHAEYCEVDGAPACWKDGTDCSTIMECNGEWEACDRGAVPHCGTNRGFTCCSGEGGSYPAFCDVEGPEYGCWGPDIDCSTVTECNGEWRACYSGGTPYCGDHRGLACCSEEYPTFCDVAGPDGGCWVPDVDCSTVMECNWEWRACYVGGTPHCGPHRGFSCCTDEYPTFCDVIGPEGGCWRPDIDCSTITECDGEWQACQSGYHYNCDTHTCES